MSLFDLTGKNAVVMGGGGGIGRALAKGFIEKGFNRLTKNGKMLMVTKRREWYKNKFIAVFGGVRIEERGGYFVFMAEKRSGRYAKSK